MSIRKKKVAFLINPTSGTSGKRRQGKEMMSELSGHKKEGLSLYETKSPEEMLEVTRHLAEKNYDAVFGCGGDGTLNLISSQLLGTDTALGIIPLGSGNGYARHLHIPMQWEKALKLVDEHRITLRDTGLFNGLHFLNIAGIGYAAKISHEFKKEVNRGLSGYARTVLKNLKMEAFMARIQNENGMWEGAVWMIDFCNGSQWGNNFRIDPGARDDDGSLNAVIFKKAHPVRLPVIGFQIATGKTTKNPDIYRMPGARFSLQFEGNRPLHLDGEAVGFVQGSAEVEVVPKSLKVWTPA